MVFSDALEVAIGLTFVFLLVSLVMTAVVEFIESIRKTRGSGLLQGIVELLGDPKRPDSGTAAARAVYEHPSIQGLFIGSFEGALKDRRLPSYLPARQFALALIDQVLGGRVNAAASTSPSSLPAQAPVGERLRLAAERIDNEQLRRAILLAVKVGGNDADRIGRHLEDWFNASMDRVSGRFKRKSQHLLFWLGLGGAVLLNVNTLTIADALTKDATLRRAVVAQAEAQAKAPLPAAADAAGARSAVDRIDELGLPIGWSDRAYEVLTRPVSGTKAAQPLGWAQIIVGYLLTALAVSLGAPFWFDMLNRLMVIRTTIKPGEKKLPDAGGKGDATAVAAVAATAGAASASTAAPPEPVIDNDVYATPPQLADKQFEAWH